jgi:hypothetical protein
MFSVIGYCLHLMDLKLIFNKNNYTNQVIFNVNSLMLPWSILYNEIGFYGPDLASTSTNPHNNLFLSITNFR